MRWTSIQRRRYPSINDAGDCQIGKRLRGLAALRQVGFQANRCLLHVQRISHDCTIGEDAFCSRTGPVRVGHQRASGLKLGAVRTQALLGALLVLRLLPAGFAAADLRAHLAPLLGLSRLRPSSPGGSATSCGDCGCTGSSSGSRAATATG